MCLRVHACVCVCVCVCARVSVCVCERVCVLLLLQRANLFPGETGENRSHSKEPSSGILPLQTPLHGHRKDLLGENHASTSPTQPRQCRLSLKRLRVFVCVCVCLCVLNGYPFYRAWRRISLLFSPCLSLCHSHTICLSISQSHTQTYRKKINKQTDTDPHTHTQSLHTQVFGGDRVGPCSSVYWPALSH